MFKWIGCCSAKTFCKKGVWRCNELRSRLCCEKVYQELLQITDESKIMKYKADVVNRQQVSAMFDEIVDKFGRVDILINFAGINRDAPFVELTDEQWDSVVSVHLKGHFVCSQEYVLHNPDREGLIINLGAACGQIGRKNGANFCSAKGGIIALTKCMALELAPRIRVN
ncbi:MAG: SDR family NAD(P)-dependent oxidoreductase, partial [Candidatus Poribacteria bacterium]